MSWTGRCEGTAIITLINPLLGFRLTCARGSAGGMKTYQEPADMAFSLRMPDRLPAGLTPRTASPPARLDAAYDTLQPSMRAPDALTPSAQANSRSRASLNQALRNFREAAWPACPIQHFDVHHDRLRARFYPLASCFSAPRMPEHSTRTVAR